MKSDKILKLLSITALIILLIFTSIPIMLITVRGPSASRTV